MVIGIITAVTALVGATTGLVIAIRRARRKKREGK